MPPGGRNGSVCGLDVPPPNGEKPDATVDHPSTIWHRARRGPAVRMVLRDASHRLAVGVVSGVPSRTGRRMGAGMEVADYPRRPHEWANKANCRTVDTNVMFPTSRSGVEKARAVCVGCPVAKECGDWAERHEAAGVWGGESIDSRTVRATTSAWQAARQTAPQRRPLSPRFGSNGGRHGTRTGYVSGCRCDACSEADRVYQHRRWLQRKTRERATTGK